MDNNNTLFIMCGLPGSGKSTKAKQLKALYGNAVIISRDALRTMINGGDYAFNQDTEPLVKQMSMSLLLDSVDHDKSVIVDETNITSKTRAFWLSKAEHFDRVVCVHCVENRRNLGLRMSDPRGYTQDKWNSVIDEMKKEFEPPKKSEGFDSFMRLEIPKKIKC